MKRQLEVDLVNVVQDLPSDKVNEVIDFASYLRSKYWPDMPQRGSAKALLQVMEQVGPLQFAPGELEERLAEIQTMREMDMQDDRLST